MGGAERVTSNLANYWAVKGWQVMVATLATAENDFYALHPAVERVSLGTARGSRNWMSAVVNNARSIREIRKLLKRWRPDVAVGMMTTANVLLALAGRGMPVLCVGSERTHPPVRPLGVGWERLRAFAYGRLDAVVALAGSSSDWLHQYTNVKRVKVIANPVLWPLPPTAPIRDCGEWLHSGRHVLLAVGRLVDEKGFDLLLQAFSRIALDLADWDLLIVGEGPERASLETQVRYLGLCDRVKLPGQVGNISDWYAAADIYAMSSRFEGFPNTLIEAMSCGLPAVSFDCLTGPRDIIRDEIDGVLVPHMDVATFAQELARLMRDEGLRAKMARRAVDARERFALDRIAGMWEKLFGELSCE
ncbi:glycosyltransferase family 4 protein [Desulfomicrobium norvegicum]|nr:glycosyltransferase family 4 protein [Desulfomicrobium norvegicum]